MHVRPHLCEAQLGFSALTHPLFLGTFAKPPGADARTHTAQEDTQEYLEEAKLKELVAKYSEFINFPIYLYGSKDVDKEVPVDEDEAPEDDEADADKDKDKDASEDNVEDAGLWHSATAPSKLSI